MSFYRMRQFQCEVTGKSNLTYFEALESELQEARTMHSRFPEPLKAATLSSVQFRAFCPGVRVPTRLCSRHVAAHGAEVMGRLDHLVDAVYERFKDRYFPEERTSLRLYPRT
jgi:bromodomain adjacent to zinc finger domain protein 1A